MNLFKQFEYVPDKHPGGVQDQEKVEEGSFASDKISRNFSLSVPRSQMQIAGEISGERMVTSVNNSKHLNYDDDTQQESYSGLQSKITTVGLAELYKSPYQQVEKRLKLLIVGHNPSHQSYSKGHYYANPVNRFWSLMRKAKLVPSHFGPHQDQDCPAKLSIGFTDLAWNFCETKSSNISDQFLYENCKADFYRRLVQHVHRVKAEARELEFEQCSPHIIAFTGVRQWKALFPANHRIQKASFGQRREKRKVDDEALPESDQVYREEEKKRSKKEHVVTTTAQKNLLEFVQISSTTNRLKVVRESEEEGISYGIQMIRPPDWPSPLKNSKVFVLPSPSGAAAMSNEQREHPYLELGQLFETISETRDLDKKSSRGEVIDMTLEDD